MNQRRHITLVAAGATLLAAMPLTSVFETWTWFVDALIVVITTTGTALIVRNLRVAAWVPTVATTLALLLVLTWVFHSGHELFGLIPTPRTFGHFNDLLVSAGNDMRDMGVPVSDRDGLLFLSTLGIGAVAVVIDLFTVVMRRPALAGLPMLAIYSVPVAVHEDSVSFVPFAAGAAGFLWLLATDNVDRIRRFGRRFNGDGRDVSAWEPSPLAAAGRRLAVVGVVVAVALPMAVPGRNGGLLARFGPTGGTGIGDGGRGGSGASVDLYAVLSGELNNTRTFDMVKVQTNDPDPYYLRFGVADDVTPDGFRNRRPGGGQPATAGIPTAVMPGSGITLHPYRAQVQIVSLNMNSLPIYLQPTKTEKLDASWFYDRTDQLLYSRQSNSRGKKYAFDYVHPEFDPQALRSARPLDANDPVQRLYTTVPKVPEVERKLAQIISGQVTPYDKVRAIHSYFSADNGFKYSLQTKSGTSGSAIVDFLNNKQGFCEQYSAAMAWLVRAAGIPARVAFGFSRGSNQGGDTWTLTNRNLHAWTEVYFDRFGWVPFDATPAAYVGGVDSAWAPDPNRPPTTPGSTSTRDDLPIPGGPNQNAAAGPSGAARPDRAETNSGPVTAAAPSSPVSTWTLLGMIVALAVLLFPAVWRSLRRRRRRPDRITGPRGAGPPTPATTVAVGTTDVVVTDEGSVDLARRRAHAAWDELIDTMIDYRLPVDLANTPRMTSEHLITAAALDEWAATGARLLGQAEERARYARQPLRSDDLTGSLRAVRDAIRQRVSWRTRVRAAFLPASVVGRWQVATSAAATGLVSAIGRRWDSAVRAVSPRRLLPGARR